MATSFAQAHFGKPIDQITADDLTEYFATERDESLTLEFKSFYAKDKFNFEGGLRAITSFLNSEGGLLIFGAPHDTAKDKDTKYRTIQASLTPVPTQFCTKDSLVNIISGNISYLPIGIRIEYVKMPEGEFVYLIEVQESDNKPHQHKKLYPIRLDGQTVSAPHYLVEAMFKQVRRPELNGFLRVVSYQLESTRYRSPDGQVVEDRNIHIFGLKATVFNVTPSINDTGVYIRLTASIGDFDKPNSKDFQTIPRAIFVAKTSSVIAYGLAFRHSFTYKINPNEYSELMTGTKSIKITMIFGGNNSAIRRSEYTINLNANYEIMKF